MPLAAPGTFADLSFFVLGDHALELKKQDVRRRLGSRRLQENDLDAVASKLIKHQDLIRIPATEAVGAVHEHDFNLSLGSQIAKTFQTGPDQRGPAPPVVLEEVAIRNHILMGGGVHAQGAGLAGDRVFLFLPVRGYPRVDRGGFYRACLPPPPTPRPPTRASKGGGGWGIRSHRAWAKAP